MSDNDFTHLPGTISLTPADLLLKSEINRLRAEVNRLRWAITDAPCGGLCATRYGQDRKCNCWRADALFPKEKP